MAAAPTVFIVDDQPAIRCSLAELLTSVGLAVKTYATAQEFLADYQPDSPGCLVLDVRLPGLGGLDLQGQLLARGIRLPIIFVTGYGDVPMAVRAMKAGALEFLEKPINGQVFLDTVHRALQEDASHRRNHAQQARVTALLQRLTPREREVLDLLVQGLPSKKVAAELDISTKTLDLHRAHILQKMEVQTVPQLILLLQPAVESPDVNPSDRLFP